jgi:S-layer homology domain
MTMMIHWSRITATGLGILLAVMLMASRSDAQSTEPRTFGTASAVSHTVGAIRFTPRASNANGYATTPADEARFCIAAPCTLVADLYLPAGALVTKFEVDGCDTDAGSIAYQVHLRRHATLGAIPGSDILQSATSVAGGGCAYVTGTLTPPETIDNQAYNYQLTFNSFVAGNTKRLQAVRVFYTLQTSPAPAVASFGDVPTNHPFFPFIEALAASGITSGCQTSPPLFCPDDPLTRGQMATFLSKALGLHFAP